MFPKFLVALVAASLVGAPSADAAGVPASPSCTKTYVVQDYRSYASRVYQRPTVSKKAHRLMARMTRCQEGGKSARRAVRKAHRRYKAERRDRKRIAAATPYSCSFGRSAIPCYIVACESGTSGYWRAYNPSGAAGLYQIMAMHGRPWPVRTAADRLAHHRIAARLWRGGAGASNWACA